MDRKWYLRDKNLFCVSSAGKKKENPTKKPPSPWPKQARDFPFCLKVAFQFVYLSLADILLQKNNLFQMERFKLAHIGGF